jgi:hypothetical protein
MFRNSVSVPSSWVGRDDAISIGNSGINTRKRAAGYEVERTNRKKGRVGVVKSVPRAGSKTVM